MDTRRGYSSNDGESIQPQKMVQNSQKPAWENPT